VLLAMTYWIVVFSVLIQGMTIRALTRATVDCKQKQFFELSCAPRWVGAERRNAIRLGTSTILKTDGGADSRTRPFRRRERIWGALDGSPASGAANQ
jgi:hypothetical protein